MLSRTLVIARKELAPLAADIDSGKVYPAELLRRFGDAGAWGSHRPNNIGAADLGCAIQSMAAIGEVCGATAFMAWCRDTLAWYAFNSDNPALASFADDVATGRVLGGTGLKVTLGNRGRIDVLVTVKGAPCHSSRPWDGINAVTGATEAIRLLLSKVKLEGSHPQLGKPTLTVNHIRSFPESTHTVQDRCELTLDRHERAPHALFVVERLQ